MDRLCIIADEVSTDFDKAIACISGWGLKNVEVHGLWDTSVELLGATQIERLRAALDAFHLAAPVVSSTVFLRCRLRGGMAPERWSRRFDSLAGEYPEHLHWLEQSLNVAQGVGATAVRVFGFWRDGPTSEAVLNRIVESLGPALELAAAAGIVLALENCPHTYLDHTRLALQVVRRVESPWLRLLWDPANALRSGEMDVAELVDEVLPVLAHVHVKGLRLTGGSPGGREYVRFDRGGIDFARLIGRLLDGGYGGQFSLEPHYSLSGDDRLGAARETVLAAQALLRTLKSAESSG